MRESLDTELLATGHYDELPECVASGCWLAVADAPAPRLGPDVDGHGLLRQERHDWSHIPNLDAFFTRLYVYYVDRGFFCSIVRLPGTSQRWAPSTQHLPRLAWLPRTSAQRLWVCIARHGLSLRLRLHARRASDWTSAPC
jgi:hypothetical protein